MEASLDSLGSLGSLGSLVAGDLKAGVEGYDSRGSREGVFGFTDVK